MKIKDLFPILPKHSHYLVTAYFTTEEGGTFPKTYIFTRGLEDEDPMNAIFLNLTIYALEAETYAHSEYPEFILKERISICTNGAD